MKVSVMRSSVVSHQIFATRIISWLQTVIAYSGKFWYCDISTSTLPCTVNDLQCIWQWFSSPYIEGLRQLFCLEIMKCTPEDQMSIVEKLMLADTKLWKSARVQTHQLYMAGWVFASYWVVHIVVKAFAIILIKYFFFNSQ